MWSSERSRMVVVVRSSTNATRPNIPTGLRMSAPIRGGTDSIRSACEHPSGEVEKAPAQGTGTREAACVVRCASFSQCARSFPDGKLGGFARWANDCELLENLIDYRAYSMSCLLISSGPIQIIQTYPKLVFPTSLTTCRGTFALRPLPPPDDV